MVILQVEQIPLPLLFMRTVLQAIGAFPGLVRHIIQALATVHLSIYFASIFHISCFIIVFVIANHNPIVNLLENLFRWIS